MENISDREIDDDVLSKAPTKQLTGKILATTDKVKEKLGEVLNAAMNTLDEEAMIYGGK